MSGAGDAGMRRLPQVVVVMEDYPSWLRSRYRSQVRPCVTARTKFLTRSSLARPTGHLGVSTYP